MQIVAGGASVNLTRGADTVAAEMPYSPDQIAQLLGRSRRIGNKNKTIRFTYPVVEKSVEIDAEKAVLGKSKMFNKIL